MPNSRTLKTARSVGPGPAAGFAGRRASVVAVARRHAQPSTWPVAAATMDCSDASPASISATKRPLAHHQDPVGDAEDFWQLRGDHEHGHTLISQLDEQPVDLALGRDVYSRVGSSTMSI